MNDSTVELLELMSASGLHPDAAVRERMRQAPQLVIDEMLGLLDDPTWGHRAELCLAEDPERTADAVERLCIAPGGQPRLCVIYLLSVVRGARSLALLMAALGSEDDRLRAEAAGRLGWAPEAAAALRRHVSDESEVQEVRISAAASLAELGDFAGLGFMLDQTRRRDWADADEKSDILAPAFIALAKLGGPIASARLFEALNDPTIDDMAIYGMPDLAKRHPEDLIPHLAEVVGRLGDSRWYVYESALDVLEPVGKEAAPVVAEFLDERLQSDGLGIPMAPDGRIARILEAGGECAAASRERWRQAQRATALEWLTKPQFEGAAMNMIRELRDSTLLPALESAAETWSPALQFQARHIATQLEEDRQEA